MITQFFIRLIGFFKETFMEDGKPDPRAITNFWFVVLATLDVGAIIFLCTLMVWWPEVATEKTIEAAQVLVQLAYPLFTMVLLLFGVVTWKQIKALKNWSDDKSKR